MTRIRFEDLPSTNTPRNAENLNKLNNVVISATKPTTGEEVWIRKGKNIFNKDNFQELTGYFNDSTTTITFNEFNKTFYLKCEPNTTYTIQTLNGGTFAFGYTTEIPKIGVQVYAATPEYTIITGNDAKYLVCRYFHTGNATVTEDEVLASIQIEAGSVATTYEEYIDKKIFVKNNNDTYDELLNVENTNNQQHYSTEEQVIGTWMGKPLYKKTMNCGVLPNNSFNYIAHWIENIKYITKIYGFASINENEWFITLPYINSSLEGIVQIDADTTQIYIGANSDMTRFNNSYVTIEYTKTTD